MAGGGQSAVWDWRLGKGAGAWPREGGGGGSVQRVVGSSWGKKMSEEKNNNSSYCNIYANFHRTNEKLVKSVASSRRPGATDPARPELTVEDGFPTNNF
jgi:hypothetical protein